MPLIAQIVILGFLFTVAVCFPPQSPEHEAMLKKCAAANDVPYESIMGNKGEITDDPKMKCLFKCILLESGSMTEAGEFVLEKYKSTMPKGFPTDKLDSIFKTAAEAAAGKTDLCDKAAAFMDTFKKEMIALFKG